MSAGGRRRPIDNRNSPPSFPALFTDNSLHFLYNAVDDFWISHVDGRDLRIVQILKRQINAFEFSVPMIIPVIHTLVLGVNRFHNTAV